MATLGALGAYFFTVLPRVRRELRRWGPLLEAKERNAEAVAVLATLAPRSRRAAAVRAIVALQVAIDLRDELEESGEGSARPAPARLEELEATWRRATATLPTYEATAPLLDQAVRRCEEGQRLTHAAAAGGGDTLRRWAETLEAPAGYRWWELAAGASSSVAAHALIAAAADPQTNPASAAATGSAYFPAIGALTVLLDDLVDRDADRAAGEHNYLAYYAGPAEAAERIAAIAERAGESIGPLPRHSRHRAILAGVAGFYAGDFALRDPSAVLVSNQLEATLGPAVRLISAAMALRRRVGRVRPTGA